MYYESDERQFTIHTLLCESSSNVQQPKEISCLYGAELFLNTSHDVAHSKQEALPLHALQTLQSLYRDFPPTAACCGPKISETSTPCAFQISICLSFAVFPVLFSYSSTDRGRSACGVARSAWRVCGQKSNVALCVTTCRQKASELE